MRVQKMSILAAAVVAAGLTLTACGGGSDSDVSSGASSSQGTANSGASSSAASDGGSGSGSGKGSGAAKGTRTEAGAGAQGQPVSGGCKTSQLAFSTSGGMAEGQILVNLKNTGSAACSMHGFPGVDLQGKDGSISAVRTKFAAPPVTLQAGQDTRFTLNYPPNNSGGSGASFTSLVVTPPNETHSHTLPVDINVPVSDGTGPNITVGPVGVGK